MNLANDSDAPKKNSKKKLLDQKKSAPGKSEARHVLCALVEDSVEDAYSLMKDIECRHLPVVREGKLIGILSDRDILLRASYGSGGISFPDLKVADIMSRDLISCIASAKLSDLAASMVKNKIDAMPVTDSENNLLGIVTSTDLLIVMQETRSEGESPLTVQDLLNRPKGN